MLDIKWIRENPDEFDAAMKKHGSDTTSAQILELDKEERGGQTGLQALQTKRNEIAKEIGKIKSSGGDAEGLIKEAEGIKKQIALTEAGEGDGGKVAELLSTVPNALLDEVPEGIDESDNIEIRRWGEPKKFGFKPRDHVDIGENLGMMDFKQAARMSGSRFVVLKSDLAQMERALAAFMLDIHTSEFGYTEISPPLLAKSNALFGTGQLPKFAEDLFTADEDRWLIPTSEVVLANMVRESIVKEEDLPIRLTAYTPCFRSEAGSAGKDTRGMIRLHQFSKVELVSITTAEQEAEEHERLTGAAEEVLQRLELPYKTMLLCSGDTGFSARRTYDIEVWLPGQDAYREISSCSMCGDFQARRMKARYKAGEKDNRFVHTLNGSGLAVGRTIVAILENYQNEDGSVTVPKMLQSYMGGKKLIQK